DRAGGHPVGHDDAGDGWLGVPTRAARGSAVGGYSGGRFFCSEQRQRDGGRGVGLGLFEEAGHAQRAAGGAWGLLRPSDFRVFPEKGAPIRVYALIVSNKSSTQRLLAAILAERGHEAKVCSTADEALAAHRQFGPCLLLVDGVSPRADALRLCRTVRKRPMG